MHLLLYQPRWLACQERQRPSGMGAINGIILASPPTALCRDEITGLTRAALLECLRLAPDLLFRASVGFGNRLARRAAQSWQW